MKSETQRAFGPHGLATDRALQAKALHEPLDGAAGNREAFSPQLPPDLPHAVDAEVLREDPLNLDLQFGARCARAERLLASIRWAICAWFSIGDRPRALAILRNRQS